MRKINSNEIKFHNADVLESDENSTLLHCHLPMKTLDGQETPGMETCGGGIVFDDIDWSGQRYFAVDVTVEEEESMTLFMYFWKKGDKVGPNNYSNRVFCGFLPGVKTRLVFDFNWLDSQLFFIPRTMGRLKMGVHGKPAVIGDMGRLAIVSKDSHKEQNIRFENPTLSNELPESPLATMSLIDEMGQYTKKTWTHKCPSVDEMVSRLNAEYKASLTNTNKIKGLSKYGGLLSKRLTEGSGFFSTHHDGNRWWLVDPEGYAFISVGIDGITPGTAGRVDMVKSLIDPKLYKDFDDNELFKRLLRNHGMPTDMEFINFGRNNLKKAFGDDWQDKWVNLTQKTYADAGLNSIGNWSDEYFIEHSDLPYAIPMSSEKPFPTTKQKIFRDFPDVFHEDYSLMSDDFATVLEKYKGDDRLIGYFMRNEPNWAFEDDLLIADELLAVDKDFASKDALITWLKEKYSDIIKLNVAWKADLSSFDDLYIPKRGWSNESEAAYADLREFSGIMIRRYCEIPAKACKKVDSDHLNLGMRWAYVHDPLLVSGFENFDVFSINCYSFNPLKKVTAVGEMTNMPVIIGEYHHGALDGTTTATGIYGVATQKDRAAAYRMYAEQGLSSPYLVGTHYFQWMDQPPLGRFDGENYNIGLVDQLSQPYKVIVDAMRETHERMYDVAEGKIEPFDEEFEKIPAIFY